ncbi:MAG: hypothetical protein ACI835_005282 [Planctomycetota bacterium]|jgi:hypothetical protein
MSPELSRIAIIALSLVGCSMLWANQAEGEPEQPRIVTSGTETTAPSDAMILFDGSSLDAWKHPSGEAAKWIVADGAATVSGGSLITKQSFGDAQVHIEFATPGEPKGEGQGRGNSGVYLQGRYEVQVLDSFENQTYPNGQCGAVYGQAPPLVNTSRGPGEWQTYDIIFRAARFDAAGAKSSPAVVTVLHNGVLIQDHHELTGPTTASLQAEGSSDGPLYLQDHGNPTRYRNLWIRSLD